jgi:hypothetical protein
VMMVGLRAEGRCSSEMDRSESQEESGWIHWTANYSDSEEEGGRDLISGEGWN